MKPSEQLAARLLKDLGLKGTSVERIRRGKSGKAAGTFAWSARLDDGTEIGSEDTIKECVRAKTLGVFKSAVHSLTPMVCAND